MPVQGGILYIGRVEYAMSWQFPSGSKMKSATCEYHLCCECSHIEQASYQVGDCQSGTEFPGMSHL